MIKNDNLGLTLIETVIALSLVLILATAFAGSMVVGLQSETTSDNLDYSSNLSASVFDFLLAEDNYREIVLEFKAKNIIGDENDDIYQNKLINEEDSFYHDLNGISNLDEKFKHIIDSFSDISGFSLLDSSEIKFDKIVNSPEDNDDLILYRVELNIISDGASGEENYRISTILGDLNE